jgi:hypothetical protein
MNLKIKIFLLCPIPEDQKPINQYINLKEDNITNLINLEQKNFLFLFLSFFFFISLIRFENFNLIHNKFFFYLVNSEISLLFLFLIYFSIYFRLKDLESKFNKSTLFYEEASWYDGQIWNKPLSILKNDRLLKIKEINPLVNKNLIILIYIILIIIILYLFILFFQ